MRRFGCRLKQAGISGQHLVPGDPGLYRQRYRQRSGGRIRMSIYEYQPAMIFFIVLAAAIGGVAGSFLNCTAWRIVRGESFTMGRSRCPSCGHTLGAAELIPVCSWLFQKGRCKWCKEKISVRYPLTELSFSLITVLCLLRFDLTVLCLRNFLFLCCLFLLTLTDLEDMIIPDGCHIAAAAAWAAPVFPQR